MTIRAISKKLFAPLIIFAGSSFAFFSVEDVPFLTFKQLRCQIDETCSREVDITDGIFFYIAVFAYIFAAIFTIFETIAETKKDHRESLSLKNKLWETELRAFSNNLKITPHDRLTFYIYIDSTKTFFKAGRESPNNKFKCGGRRTYTSGLIESAFNEIDGTVKISSDPNNDYRAYIEEVAKKSGLEKSVIKKLSMKSRYLYARKVQKLNGIPIGVLLFETIKPELSHIQDDMGTSLDGSKMQRIFKRECARLAYFLEEFEPPATLFQIEEGRVIQ